MSAALQLPVLWGASCGLDDDVLAGRPLPLTPSPANPRLKKPVRRAEAIFRADPLPRTKPLAPAKPQLPTEPLRRVLAATRAEAASKANPEPETTNLIFFRKHTERLLRRYLYASMQVGRSPSILSDPVARGWVSSRPVKSFEDAVIFVLDVERCLNQLCPLDQKMICRVVLQEYTQAEAAVLVGMSLRSFSTKFAAAIDRLTARLLESGVLVLPK